MHNLLLIDDDLELCELIKEYLENDGFDVTVANTAKKGITSALNNNYDLIILDVMLPDLNGYDVLKKIQKYKKTPIIMLTAKGDEVDLVVGLDMGADDYLAKPCRPRELVARIKANIRRSFQVNSKPEEKDSRISIGSVILDKTSHAFYINDKELNLTTAEYNLLSALFSKQGETVSKEQLSELAMGRKLTPYDRSIDVHLCSIRKKLEAVEPEGLSIKNIRGVGYTVSIKN